MHRTGDLAVQQRAVELLGPQGLAADLRERAILHPVAGGANRHDRDGFLRPAMRGAQGIAHHMCLEESERRTAGAEAEEGIGHGGLC